MKWNEECVVAAVAVRSGPVVLSSTGTPCDEPVVPNRSDVTPSGAQGSVSRAGAVGLKRRDCEKCLNDEKKEIGRMTLAVFTLIGFSLLFRSSITICFYLISI